MEKPKLVVITGAGISQESGIKTFRDSGGLWEGHDIMEVASIEGWLKNPEKVLQFYNLRRENVRAAQPNKAHSLLAELEKDFDVTIITQNIDDLHERAGSKKVIHLHGEITKGQSNKQSDLVVELSKKDINMGDLAPDGSQLRPHVVWFGEAVPKMSEAAEIVAQADVLLVIGTSLVVYPAASLVGYVPEGVPVYVIDPVKPEAIYTFNEVVYITEKASTGTAKWVQQYAKA